MKRILHITILSIVLLLPFGMSGTNAYLCAQSEPEYTMEIGGGFGLVAYEGDFNGMITHCNQPSAEITLRNLFNPRQGLKFQLGYGKLKGSSEKNTTAYPDYNTGQYGNIDNTNGAFSNTLIDLNCTYEYNFWPFGTGKEYRGAKPFTPFIFVGGGFSYVTGSNTLCFNAPIGVGVKYKLAPRINVNLSWAMHFTTSDMLDGVQDPYIVESSGIFKNNDCYSRLMIGFTYSFKERCRVCHNDDE